MYVKYSVSHGPDWTTVYGLEHGISQIAKKRPGEDQQVLVWNYPIDITFRSVNASGWPQIVFRCHYVTFSVLNSYISLMPSHK